MDSRFKLRHGKEVEEESQEPVDVSNKLDKTPEIQNLKGMTENEYENLSTKPSTTIYFLT